MNRNGTSDEDAGGTDGDGPDPGALAVEHVLAEVYPDRLEASVMGIDRTDGGVLVGVKADPRGYVSTAKYALVRVADGQVVGAETATGREVRRELGIS